MFRLFFVFTFLFGNLLAQDSTDVRRILSFQDDLNKKFASEEQSPLSPKDLKQFKTLKFFKIDTSYCIRAKFIRTPYETPFIMKTTLGTEPLYVKYGEVHFVLEDKDFVLSVYQNQNLTTQPEYENYLFLPFTDLTNGELSYEGGRFIDLRIPEGETILIDFNTAYSPYCEYNDRYSCAVPPDENHMDLKIMAGVKKYKKHPDNE